MAFEAFIGLRVPLELKLRYLRLAKHADHRGRDEADLGRMALEDFLKMEEGRLKLGKMSDQEKDDYEQQLDGRRDGTPAKQVQPSYLKKPRADKRDAKDSRHK